MDQYIQIGSVHRWPEVRNGRTLSGSIRNCRLRPACRSELLEPMKDSNVTIALTDTEWVSGVAINIVGEFGCLLGSTDDQRVDDRRIASYRGKERTVSMPGRVEFSGSIVT